MRATANQLKSIRSRNQRTKLHLIVFNPKTVMKARLNSNISKGSMTIPYGNVSTGSVFSVENGMTLLVGSSDGLQDYGRIRVRTGTSSYLSVAENDHIQWVSGAYLSVQRFWDVVPVFPRIIKNPNNETDIITYKDYDVPHTNQNTILGTLINMGSHRGVLIENGTGTVYYTSTGTLNLAGSALTYDWAFEGGTPTGSTQKDPGNVYYTTPGDYVTRLKTTATNSAKDTSYRYVSVRNKIGEGGVTPIVRWKATTLSGSRDEGGYSMQISVYDNIQLEEGSLILVMSEDWYDGSKLSIGGNNENGSSVFFVGYIEGGSIKYSWDKSYFDFTASSVTSLMKKSTGFSVSVESKQVASNWFQLQDMDIRRAIYHYLRWQTTVLSTTDVRFIGTDRKIQFFDADRTSIYEAINSLISDTLLGSVASDRQGALYCEVNPIGYSNPTGSFTPIMSVTRADWMGEPSIVDRPYGEASYIELGGIAYSGAKTGTFTAHLSGAPGDVPAIYGSVNSDPGGLALASQTQLNQLSGNVYYDLDFRYPSISMDNSVALRNLDIAPIEAVDVQIQASDTVANKAIQNLYYTNGMNFTYDSEKELLLSNVDLKSIVTGIPGDTIDIPPTPEDFDDFEFEDFPFPELPVLEPLFTVTDPLQINNALWWILGRGFFYTNNLADVSPTWNEMMVNILPEYGDPLNFEITATGKVFAHFTRYILKAEALGSPWQIIFDAISSDTNIGVGNPESFPFPRNETVLALGVDRTKDEDVFILGSLIISIFSVCVVYAFRWDGTTFTRVSATSIFTPSSANRHGYIVRTNNSWLVSYYNGDTLPSSAILDEATFVPTNIFIHNQAIAKGIVIDSSLYSPASSIFKLNTPNYTTNGGITWLPITGSTTAPYQQVFNDKLHSIIDDGYGTIIYGKEGSLGYAYSYNGGVTFADSTEIFAGGASTVNHLGGGVYIFGDDAGHFWVVDGLTPLSTGSFVYSKDGNISYLITGSFTPQQVRFYG